MSLRVSKNLGAFADPHHPAISGNCAKFQRMRLAPLDGMAIGLRYPLAVRGMHSLGPESRSAGPMLGRKAEQLCRARRHKLKVRIGQVERPDHGTQVGK